MQIFLQTPNRSSFVSDYYTGTDGMYYFNNIAPGRYALVVNGSLNFSIVVEDIDFQDLPPVLLRC